MTIIPLKKLLAALLFVPVVAEISAQYANALPAARYASRGSVTGEDFTAPDGSFATHATVREFPQEGVPLYEVAVNGRQVGLYTDKSHWGGLVHFGSFEFEAGREITVDINYTKDIRCYEILPKTLALESVRRTSSRSLRLRLSHPDQNITLIVNGEPKKDVLHLFAASTDSLAPAVESGTKFLKDPKRRLIYFGAGYHDLKTATGNAELDIPNSWTVYVAAGAVVYGRMTANSVGKGTRLCGRGMIYNDENYAKMLFTVNHSMGMEVEGVLFHAHRPQCWQVGVTKSRNIVFHGVKILCTRYASTDGLDVINSQDCTFENMFIRANDDAVAIKGLHNGKPADSPSNKNLLFRNMQLWNDCNCAFGMGAETHAAAYENIRLLNSCVLFSYDDPQYHGQLDERAALTVCCLHGTYFRNILYENVDIYHCERLIALGFKPDFWFGTLKGDQSTEGGIGGVTFRNVRSYASSGSAIANRIHLYGWDASGTPPKFVENIVFDNVRIEKKRVKSTADKHFTWGENVRNIFCR